MAGGLSKARLSRMRTALSRHVESGRMPGLVALVSRRGETHVEAIGLAAFGASEPMRRDTIFRIASLTKPVTAALAMTFVEECRLRLDDPVDPYLPELANRRMLRAVDGPIDDTDPAARPITLRDLLTFRAGYGAVMVWPETYPIQKAMRDAGVAPGFERPTLPPDELMKRYGSLPLLHQPGDRWHYDSGSDILGVLIARVAGKSLGDIMRERIFEPLGMKDTGFHVPPDKIHRLPAIYRSDETGGAHLHDVAAGGLYAKPPIFESGAGGLVSTVDDYLAFSRMMLDKGKAGRGRILSRPSVELMTSDHITPEQKAASPFVPGFWDNRGWGFGLAVTTRRDDFFAPGRFGWDGGYGTSGYCDPNQDLAGVLMTQRMMESPEAPAVFLDFWTSAYQAIDD